MLLGPAPPDECCFLFFLFFDEVGAVAVVGVVVELLDPVDPVTVGVSTDLLVV